MAALEKKKKKALELYYNGQNAYKNRDFNIAIRYFERCINVFVIPSSYIYLGNSYIHIKLFDQAIADYTMAIQLNSNLIEAYNNRAVAWEKKGDNYQAIADYTMAIELNPNYAKVYYNRGGTWEKKGDFDQAIADFTKAIKLNPNFSEAYYNRGVSWEKKGIFNQALYDYTEAIKLNSKNSQGIPLNHDLYASAIFENIYNLNKQKSIFNI